MEATASRAALWTLDARVLELTFGAVFRLNLLGLVGAVLVLVAQFRRS